MLVLASTMWFGEGCRDNGKNPNPALPRHGAAIDPSLLDVCPESPGRNHNGASVFF